VFDTDQALLAANPQHYRTDVQSLRRTIELQELAALRAAMPTGPASAAGSASAAVHAALTAAADVQGSIRIGRVLNGPISQRNPYMDGQEDFNEQEAARRTAETEAARQAVLRAAEQNEQVWLERSAAERARGLSTPLRTRRVTADTASRVLRASEDEQRREAEEQMRALERQQIELQQQQQLARAKQAAMSEEEKEEAVPETPSEEALQQERARVHQQRQEEAAKQLSHTRRIIVEASDSLSDEPRPPPELADPLEPHAAEFAELFSVAALPSGEGNSSNGRSRPTSAHARAAAAGTPSNVPECTPARFTLLWQSLQRAHTELHERKTLLSALQAELLFTRSEWEASLSAHASCVPARKSLEEHVQVLRAEGRRLAAREEELLALLAESQATARRVQETLASTLSSSGAESGGLRTQLSDALRRVAALEQENSKCHAQIHSLQSDAQSKTASSLEQTNELLSLRYQLEQARQRLTADFAIHQREREEASRLAAKHKAERTGMQQDMDKQHKLGLELRASLATATCEADAKEDEHKRRGDVLRGKNSELAQKNHRIDTLEQELQKTVLQLTAADARHTAAKLSLAVAEQAESSNSEALSSMREQLASQTAELNKLREEREGVERGWGAQLAAAEASLRDLQSQLRDAQSHAAHAAEIASLQTKLLRKQLASAETSLAEVRDNAELNGRDLAAATASLGQRARQVAQLESECAEARAALAALRGEHSDVRTELAEVKHKYKGLKGLYVALQNVARRSDGVEGARAALEAQLADNVQALANERARSAKAEAQLAELQRQVQEAAESRSHENANNAGIELQQVQERLRQAESEIAEWRTKHIALERAAAAAAAKSAVSAPVAPAAAPAVPSTAMIAQQELQQQQLSDSREECAALKVEAARLQAELARTRTEHEVAMRAQLRRSQQMGPSAPYTATVPGWTRSAAAASPNRSSLVMPSPATIDAGTAAPPRPEPTADETSAPPEEQADALRSQA
jgi:hypothetical protein